MNVYAYYYGVSGRSGTNIPTPRPPPPPSSCAPLLSSFPSDTVTVRVNRPPKAVIVAATPALGVNFVELNASSSFDPDGSSIARYGWTSANELKGEDSRNRGNCSGQWYRVVDGFAIDSGFCYGEVVKFSDLTDADYTFTLHVWDEYGAMDSANVTLTVAGVPTVPITYIGALPANLFFACVGMVAAFLVLCPASLICYCLCLHKRKMNHHKKRELLKQELGSAYETFVTLSQEKHDALKRKDPDAAISGYDEDGDGMVDRVEFKVMMHLLSDDDIGDEEIDNTFNYLDKDNNGGSILHVHAAMWPKACRVLTSTTQHTSPHTCMKSNCMSPHCYLALLSSSLTRPTYITRHIPGVLDPDEIYEVLELLGRYKPMTRRLSLQAKQGPADKEVANPLALASAKLTGKSATGADMEEGGVAMVAPPKKPAKKKSKGGTAIKKRNTAEAKVAAVEGASS